MQVTPKVQVRNGLAEPFEGHHGATEVVACRALASKLLALGAPGLHVVNVDAATSRDGARDPRQVASAIAIEGVLRDLPDRVLAAGGVRHMMDIEALLAHRARVVGIGTQAFAESAWFEETCALYPDRLAVVLDVCADGQVWTSGRSASLGRTAVEVIEALDGLPLSQWVVHLQGGSVETDLELLASIQDATDRTIELGGPFTSMEAIDAARSAGLRSILIDHAVVGKTIDPAALWTPVAGAATAAR